MEEYYLERAPYGIRADTPAEVSSKAEWDGVGSGIRGSAFLSTLAVAALSRMEIPSEALYGYHDQNQRVSKDTSIVNVARLGSNHAGVEQCLHPRLGP